MLGAFDKCGSLPQIQIGDEITPYRPKRSVVSFGPENALVDSECEQDGNYWILPDGQTGSFIVDTLCVETFYEKFYIRNTHNAQLMNM